MRNHFHRLFAFIAINMTSACSDPDLPVSLSFTAYHQGGPISCGSVDAVDRLMDLRFYVHDIAVSDENGNWQAVSLETSSPWQNNRVALLDLEDGSDSCRGGSVQTNDTVSGFVSKRPQRGLRFTVGIPFELNHANPAVADSPLNQSVMHWHWQGGYKFMRAGIASHDGLAWVHLGSTECQGAVGAIEECNHPNRIVVELPDFDIMQDGVTVNVDQLFDGVSLGQGTPAGCMAQPDDPTCATILRNLGLMRKDGVPAPQQVVFGYVSGD